MSRCIVVAEAGGDGAGGSAANIAVALARLDAEVAVVTRLGEDAADCELLVLTAEVDDARLEAAAAWAERARPERGPGGRRLLVLLRASPARRLPVAAWRAADVVVCNQAEAAALTGTGGTDPLEAEDAAVALLGMGPSLAVVTLGAEGAVVARAGRATYLPPFTTEVVDPSGAGDCFCAALGLGILEGLDNFAATGYAMAAAAVSVGRRGCAESMPNRDEVDRMAHSVDLRRDPGTLPVEFPR